MKHFAALFGLLLAAAPAVKFVGVETEANTIAFVCDGSRWTKKNTPEKAAHSAAWWRTQRAKLTEDLARIERRLGRLKEETPK